MKAFFEHFTSAAVAFSGGADSTCVLMLACEFLGADNVTAYTCSDSYILSSVISPESLDALHDSSWNSTFRAATVLRT